MLVLAALAGALATGASASAATPPPGAAISDSLEYVGRVPNSSRIVEGKFDTVAGRDVLVTTGRYGFRTYDVTDESNPKPLDTFQPSRILGENGYWQDEDMELDLRRKLIIGALDPRHDDVDQESCPGIGTLGEKNRNPNCRSGFFIISYADPTNLTQIGDFVDVPAGHTTSCVDGCNYVWTGGPARRDDLAFLGPFTPGGRGDGRPIWVTNIKDPAHPRDVLEADRPQPQRRADGLLPRRRRRRQRDRVGERSRRAARLSRRAASGAIRSSTGCARRSRGTRCWWPAAACPAATRGVAQPQTDFIHNAARPLNGRIHASGVADDNIALMTEEDFTAPCNQGGRIVAADITSSLGGEGSTNSTPENAVPDDRAGLVPPGARRARTRCRRTRSAPRTTSRCRARRSQPPGTTRACG